MVPTVLSDADAAHLVGLCTACKRTAEDPLRAIQLAEVWPGSDMFMHYLARTAVSCPTVQTVPAQIERHAR